MGLGCEGQVEYFSFSVRLYSDDHRLSPISAPQKYFYSFGVTYLSFCLGIHHNCREASLIWAPYHYITRRSCRRSKHSVRIFRMASCVSKMRPFLEVTNRILTRCSSPRNCQIYSVCTVYTWLANKYSWGHWIQLQWHFSGLVRALQQQIQISKICSTKLSVLSMS